MGFLEKIIGQKEQEVARKKVEVPLETLEKLSGELPTRDFRGALTGGNRIIAEVKRKSPRVDAFAQGVNIKELAARFEQSGAAAVSIVTDEANFDTSLDDATDVRGHINIPLLVKDFVLDPYQIFEARVHGADAILLIGRILTPHTLASMIEIVRGLGADALVEVHSKEEMQTALDAGADIIGINNRDLDSLEVSLDLSRKLALMVPSDVITVAESGIYHRDEIEELTALGVDAFLIGGALLESTDPERLLKQLLGKLPSDDRSKTASRNRK